MAEDVTGAGQAPATAQGQEPTTTHTANTPVVSQEQATGTPPEGETPGLSPEAMAAELTRARREAAGYRSRLTVLEKAQKEAEDAKLSEQEKLTKRATQLEAELTFERQDRQDRVNRYEVQLAATRLGIVDADAAVKLLDWSSLEYEEDGRPRDIDRALKTLVKERPYLADTPAAPQMAATNGATRTQTPGQRIYTKAELNDYAFYSAHRDDIVQAMRDGRITD